jgi:hypothetical protein
MTHEEILELGFEYAPVVSRPNLHRKGDRSFNRYEHRAYKVAMQHYVDEDRFVVQRFSDSTPCFNGTCRDSEELLRALSTGSVMSDGDTVSIFDGRIGFLLASVSAPSDNISGYCHFVMRSSGVVTGFGYESQLFTCRMVLTEKTAFGMAEEIAYREKGKKRFLCTKQT